MDMSEICKLEILAYCYLTNTCLDCEFAYNCNDEYYKEEIVDKLIDIPNQECLFLILYKNYDIINYKIKK